MSERTSGVFSGILPTHSRPRVPFSSWFPDDHPPTHQPTRFLEFASGDAALAAQGIEEGSVPSGTPQRNDRVRRLDAVDGPAKEKGDRILPLFDQLVQVGRLQLRFGCSEAVMPSQPPHLPWRK